MGGLKCRIGRLKCKMGSFPTIKMQIGKITAARETAISPGTSFPFCIFIILAVIGRRKNIYTEPILQDQWDNIRLVLLRPASIGGHCLQEQIAKVFLD